MGSSEVLLQRPSVSGALGCRPLGARPFPWEPRREYVKMRLRKSYFSNMVKPAPSKRKVKWLRYVLLSILGLGVYYVLSGPRGALNLIKLRKANADQARELDSLTAVRAELAVEKVRLEKDSGYIESVARKDMGMAKPGEKVFRFMGSAGQGTGARKSK